MILNSEDTDVGVINKENAEGGNNIRIESYKVWKRNIVRLGILGILMIHISNKHATNLH